MFIELKYYSFNFFSICAFVCSINFVLILILIPFLMQAPPNIVTSEQRHAAEAVFMKFRKTKSPYELCKHILRKLQFSLKILN